MDFRWVAGIALWTFLSGPAIGPPAGAGVQRRSTTAVATHRGPTTSAKRATNQKTTVVKDYTRMRSQ
jgi:hypothetical protein